MKRILFFLLLLPVFANSQVLNIEDERIKTDTTGWSGNAFAAFNLMKSNQQFTDINGKIHVQYKTDRSLYLILSNLNLVKAGGTDFSNSGIQHLRYNYKLNDWLAAELFTQAQFNKIIGIKFRALAGAGPRFRVIKSESFRLYAAWLYMYEYEELDKEDIINRNHRISSYVSFTLKLNDRLKLINTSYFQPLINDFNDFKFSSETDFEIMISKKFSYALSYSYYYDAFPPLEVPQSVYALTNKISFRFGK
jgi:hypothetical protein